MRFEGKLVLVTGAAAGIGRAAAARFAAEGARVCATDVHSAWTAPFEAGGNIETATLDVTKGRDIAALSARLGPIDVLFNCAGVVTGGAILGTSRADWDLAFAVNVTGMYELTRAILPDMLKRGRGAIVNMASVVSCVRGTSDRCAYGASKAAVVGLTKSIAADYVTRGIRCNAVCPGTIDTPSLQARLRAGDDYEATHGQFVSRQPMGRFGRPEEVADLVLYLASDEASFITGQAIAIDGGWSA